MHLSCSGVLLPTSGTGLVVHLSCSGVLLPTSGTVLVVANGRKRKGISNALRECQLVES